MKARLLMLTTAILAITLAVAPCWAQGPGTGELHVWTAAVGGSEIPANPSGSPPYSIDIYPGQNIWIQITGITEFGPGEQITVWIQFSPWVMTISTTVEGDGSTPRLAWTVGMFDDGDHTAEMEYCMTGVVFYGVQTNKYKAQNQFGTQSGGHLHVIPEVPLGAVAPLAAGLLALAVMKRRRL